MHHTSSAAGPASHGKQRRDCAHPATKEARTRPRARAAPGWWAVSVPLGRPGHGVAGLGPPGPELLSVHTSQNVAMKEHSDKNTHNVPVSWGLGLGQDRPHLHAGCLCLRPSVWNVLERYSVCVGGTHTRGVTALAPQSPAPCIHSASDSLQGAFVATIAFVLKQPRPWAQLGFLTGSEKSERFGATHGPESLPQGGRCYWEGGREAAGPPPPRREIRVKTSKQALHGGNSGKQGPT